LDGSILVSLILFTFKQLIFSGSKYNFVPLLGHSLRTQATAGATPATRSEPPKPPPVTTSEVKQPLNMKTQGFEF